MSVIHIILLICTACVFLLASYPVFAWLRSVLFPNDVKRSESFIRPVSIIIACFNEDIYIKDKIESFLIRDDWIDGSEIIVVSGGSFDNTNSILASYDDHPNVQVILKDEQIGKIASVNLAVESAEHELLVFSDVRQEMKPGSVKSLIYNFNDPLVGTVSSTLVNQDNSKFSFRNLLNLIAYWESKTASCLNVFGALYAQRKSVFRKIPADILFDDLFVVVSTIQQGKRLIMEKETIIYDISFQDYYRQNRIRRLSRGLLIFLVNHSKLIFRLPPGTLLRFLIFKYLKIILPFFLILLIPICIILILSFPTSYQLIILLIVMLIFTIRESRKLVLHIISINFNIMISTIQFVFFSERSIKWDKLEHAQRNHNSRGNND